MKNGLRLIADMGRNGDDTLVHMSRQEVRDIEKILPLTRNPKTGLPEAFGLKDIVSVAAPIAGAFGAPLISDAAGSLFGITDPDTLRLIGAGVAGLGGAAASGLAGGDPISGGLLGFGGGMLGNWVGDQLNPAPTNPGEEMFGPAAPEGYKPTWLGRNGTGLGLGALGLGALGAFGGGMGGKSSGATTPTPTVTDPSTNKPLPVYTMNRQRVDPTANGTSWYRLGRIPNTRQFFTEVNPRFMAGGGPVRGAPNPDNPNSALGQMSRLIDGTGGGQDDHVPIMGSRGEFVHDATTVADLGDGSTQRGAEKMEEIRRLIAKDKGRKKVVPKKAKSAAYYYNKVK